MIDTYYLTFKIMYTIQMVGSVRVQVQQGAKWKMPEGSSTQDYEMPIQQLVALTEKQFIDGGKKPLPDGRIAVLV
jgi:hypothetical protein